MIEISGLHAGYGKVPILHDITFSLVEKEAVAIIGPNGAGKSTLLKTIAGLVRPTSGHVHFNGRDLTGLPAHQVMHAGVVYVPEGGRPFANMTVQDNLLMGAYGNRAILKTGILEEIYTLFPILQQRRNQLARTLSGGERQMLAIARGLVSRPKLLMLDEPSLGLAPKLVDDIYEKIRTLRTLGLTVLLVEQNISYALELAERSYVLENGRIVLSGPASELAQSQHIKKHYLGF